MAVSDFVLALDQAAALDVLVTLDVVLNPDMVMMLDVAVTPEAMMHFEKPSYDFIVSLDLELYELVPVQKLYFQLLML